MYCMCSGMVSDLGLENWLSSIYVVCLDAIGVRNRKPRIVQKSEILLGKLGEF